ncbi:hypothetical protein OAR96_02045 [Euryarchaeota archaeon]|nr:hypothetical protein [Euryarchaeota archaeon]
MEEVSSKKFLIDTTRLEQEQGTYEEWLEENTEAVYQIAENAKSKQLDFEKFVEIPRASDLASRTEKLLEDYLDGMKIEDDLRHLLNTTDRESASIQIAVDVARKMNEQTLDMQKSIDCGIRVGLAVLTEAVLVAPLDGIGDVRILNNADGTEFLSIDFCGPIRAAGGTAQALGVLIGDMVRRELGLSRYVPTTQEVERVKEEFGLYRVGLQYKPPPEEIETIMRACPVMVNGEETEKIECSGYKEVRNIVNSNGSYRTRIRGGVMLVIGEGLCLKAPKVQKHTERMNIQGWEFIAQFANKNKANEEDINAFKPREIAPIRRYMEDVIAGRPVFGEPNQPGGFRLRYGRSRITGLAAAGMNPVTMEAMGGFLAVGTQMKIERPGKACAITPCTEIDGPTVLMENGDFRKIRDLEDWRINVASVKSIWDAGEILIGYGEFLENNKKLVPSAYNKDWWASDLIESLDMPAKVEKFAEILGIERNSLPKGLPFNGAIKRGGESPLDRKWRKREWVMFLRRLELNWEQIKQISIDYGTAIPPPWNLWWSDLPISFIPTLVDNLVNAKIQSKEIILTNVVSNWPIENSLKEDELPEQITQNWPRWTQVKRNGIIKSALMTLGVEHFHEKGNIIIKNNWESLLEGLGLELFEGNIKQKVEIKLHVNHRVANIKNANSIIAHEAERIEELEHQRELERIVATTAARQSGMNIEETEKVGNKAAEKIIDLGTKNIDELFNSKTLIDENEVERSLWIIRKVSNLRWEDSVPCRIGSRMGRPEKSARRELKPLTHSLYPIGENGGSQKLLIQAANKGRIRVEMGRRVCQDCGKESPYIICHNRKIASEAIECGGRTIERKSRGGSLRRRKGERTTVELDKILEVKRRSLGLDRLPQTIKAQKELLSVGQTPEPIEKGILRGKHGVSVFRDGTSRYDMIDVPVTHFKPKEIYTSWKKLFDLGYKKDVYGNALVSDEQILELFPQDIIPSLNAEEHLISTCNFVDDLLVRFYKMEPFYNVENIDDIVGALAIGLAPHTSGGVLCRIIGWTKASAGYAHPLFHAAKRRNCDGDEDSILMLMDGLLNFSKHILPSGRGGRMDAPLVLTTRLNPSEIDKEALNVDCSHNYSRRFYEETLNQPHPNELSNIVETVESRLGTIGDLRGYGWTHESGDLDAGPTNSSYKTLKSMEDKMNGQLAIGSLLRSVRVEKVASQVIESHFLPDLRGNLVAFTRQRVRCVKCGEKYRRMPLAGKCIQRHKLEIGGLSARRGEDTTECGGNVILTVSEGNVRKYIKVTEGIIQNYGVDMYTEQRVKWLTESTDSLFNNDRVTVMTLSDFL